MKYFPWILVVIWLAARVAVGRYMGLEEAKNFGVLTNVLLVLVIVFITIYNKYKTVQEDKPTFFQDVKDCMKQAMKYVIGASVAIGLYYGVMSEDVKIIRETRLKTFQEQIASEEGLNKFYEEFPQTKGKSREELNETNKKNVETFVSVKTQVLIGFVTLSFVSFVYTLLAVLIWRTVMRRN